MNIALDSSALLALLFDEPGHRRVENVIHEAILSAVNLAEVVSKLIDSGYQDAEAKRAIDGFLPLVAPFDISQAVDAGALRRETRNRGLSLGDRACLALARRESARVMTADRAWADLDLGVEIEIIR